MEFLVVVGAAHGESILLQFGRGRGSGPSREVRLAARVSHSECTAEQECGSHRRASVAELERSGEGPGTTIPPGPLRRAG